MEGQRFLSWFSGAGEKWGPGTYGREDWQEDPGAEEDAGGEDEDGDEE